MANTLIDLMNSTNSTFTQALLAYVQKVDKNTYAGFTEEQNAFIDTYCKNAVIQDYNFIKGLSDDEQKNMYMMQHLDTEYDKLEDEVAEQIEARKRRFEAKLPYLQQVLSCDTINVADWDYDGMKDVKSCGSPVYCDLCGYPIKYVHFAVHKETNEGLKFGCDCIADFFNLGVVGFSALTSVQQKILRDIRIIIALKENNCEDLYLKECCGLVGETFKKTGADGIKELETFNVGIKSNTMGVVELDEDSSGNIKIVYNDREEWKPLDWLVTHADCCLNGDISANGEFGYVPPSTTDKRNRDNAQNIDILIAFIEKGLPMPYSVVKAVNSSLRKASDLKPNDYVANVEELLISENLKQSQLLRQAFSDFMKNIIGRNKGVEKDIETDYWGAKGVTSFYYIVLLWEGTIQKLLSIREAESFLRGTVLTDEEFDNLYREQSYMILHRSDKASVEYYFTKKTIWDYIDKCYNFFIGDTVLIDKSKVDEGYSKYYTPGVDYRLGLVKDTLGNRTVTNKFTVSAVPTNIRFIYSVLEAVYREVINKRITFPYKLLSAIKGMNSIDLVKYFYRVAYKSIGTTISSSDLNMEEVTALELKYHDLLQSFNYDSLLKELHELNEIVKKVKPTFKVKKDEIKKDYEDIRTRREAGEIVSYSDCFKRYTDLLVGHQDSEEIRVLVKNKDLISLSVFEDLARFEPLFKEIQSNVVTNEIGVELNKFYSELGLNKTIELIDKITSTTNVDKFIIGVLYILSHIELNIEDKEIKTLLRNSKTPLADESSDIAKKMFGLLPACLMSAAKSREDLFIQLKKDMEQLSSALKSLDNSSYLGFYKVLKAESSEVEYMCENRTEVKCDKLLSVFKDLTKCTLTAYYDTDELNNLFDLFEYCSGLFKGCYNDVISFVNEEVERFIESKKGITTKIATNITPYLSEHIKFFEVDVDALRKSKYSYGSKQYYSDSGIRRAEAFRNVKYNTSLEEAHLFVKELELSKVSLSEDVAKAIAELDTDTNDGMVKLRRNMLLDTCYSNKLIYNHYDLTYKVLKALQKGLNMPSVSLSQDDMDKVSEILKKYYLFASEINYLNGVVESLGTVDYNYTDEIKKLDDIKEGTQNSSDYDGVQRANTIINDTKFSTLPDYLQSIVKTVVNKGTCSSKQLVYVNKAYVELGLGVVDNAVSNDAVENYDEKGKDLAKKLLDSPDFDTIPELAQKIAQTVSTKGTCSEKQWKHIERAAKKLGLLD